MLQITIQPDGLIFKNLDGPKLERLEVLAKNLDIKNFQGNYKVVGSQAKLYQLLYDLAMVYDIEMF